MTEYLTNTSELTAVADAIREKGGTTEQLSYPDGFVSAIEAIEASEWQDISDQLTFDRLTVTDVFAVSNGTIVNVIVYGLPTATLVSPVINLPVAITGGAVAKQKISNTTVIGTISGQTVTYSASKGSAEYYYFITGTIIQ